jgi:hypothetical protein
LKEIGRHFGLHDAQVSRVISPAGRTKSKALPFPSQAGDLAFRVADPARDQSLLPAAQQAADLLLRDYPELVEPLVRRWLGRREDYRRV